VRRIGAVSVVAITLRSNARYTLKNENKDEIGVAALGKQYKISGVMWIEAWPNVRGCGTRPDVPAEEGARGRDLPHCNALPGTVMIPQAVVVVVVVVCTGVAVSRFRRR